MKTFICDFADFNPRLPNTQQTRKKKIFQGPQSDYTSTKHACSVPRIVPTAPTAPPLSLPRQAHNDVIAGSTRWSCPAELECAVVEMRRLAMGQVARKLGQCIQRPQDGETEEKREQSFVY
jgi:hypothetical protein